MPGDDGQDIISTRAISNYSYINARDDHQADWIARCLTGLGPNSTEGNDVLGKCYFNGSSLPFVDCDDGSSAVVQLRPTNRRAGIINIWQCREFTTDVEGIYTCIIVNSSMIYDN